MFDYLYLGSTPPLEECTQLGWKANSDSWKQARDEMKKYISQLNAMFHPLMVILDINPVFVIKKENGGEYAEVCLRYDCGNDLEVKFSSFVDTYSPACWQDNPTAYGKADWDMWLPAWEDGLD